MCMNVPSPFHSLEKLSHIPAGQLPLPRTSKRKCTCSNSLDDTRDSWGLALPSPSLPCCCAYRTTAEGFVSFNLLAQIQISEVPERQNLTVHKLEKYLLLAVSATNIGLAHDVQAVCVTKAALKVMTPISLYWSMKSEWMLVIQQQMLNIPATIPLHYSCCEADSSRKTV